MAMTGAMRGLLAWFDGQSVLFFEARRRSDLPVFALPSGLFTPFVLAAIVRGGVTGNLSVPSRDDDRMLQLHTSDGGKVFEQRVGVHLS
jgi:hypothetical protein